MSPLQISDNDRYLVTSDGSPFLIQGDAGWSLIVSTTQSGADQYLTNRASLGFNMVLVNLIEHQFSPNAPRNLAGDYPFFNASTGQTRAFIDPPNEAYFAHADWVINRADELGVYVLLDPSYLGFNGGNEGFYQDMVAAGPTAMREWGRYVGNRYKDYTNIVWMEGGDYTPPASGKELVNQVALGIEEFSTNIQTAHQSPEDSARDVWETYPWLDINNTYTYGLSYLKSLTDYNRTPVSPTFLVEDTYENENGVTEQRGRASKYWNLLSGSTGALMGNRPVWGFFSNWQNSLDTPMSNNMFRLGNVFSSRPWYSLVPDQNHTVVTSGFGSFGSADYVTAARSSDGSLVMAYVPTSSTLTVDMSKLSGPVTAAWFDPTNGSYFIISGSPFANTGSRDFLTPGINSRGDADWVLLLTVNVAPVLDNSGSMSLDGILQNATGNHGTKIANLIASAGGDRITDVNPDAVEGIAITAANTTSGSWQYSINDGVAWSPIGAVSSTNARLLSADANTRIRFVPNATFNGTISEAITFRAWDRTAGVNGGTSKTNSNGASTTFSSASETASLLVTPAVIFDIQVNVTPSFTPGADQVIDEDAGAQTVTDWANNISRGPVEESAQTLQFLVSTDNDALFSVFPTIDADGTLTYRPAPSANGTATITVRLKDDGTVTNISEPQTFTITVNSLNDAPVLDNSGRLTLVPHHRASAIGRSIVTFIADRISDIDANATKGIAVVGTTGMGQWQFSLDNGKSWTPLGRVTRDAAILMRDSDRVRFVPKPGFTRTASLTYHAWDRTTGDAGDTANISLGTGGTTAFSNASEWVTLKIHPPLTHDRKEHKRNRVDSMRNLSLPVASTPDDGTANGELRDWDFLRLSATSNRSPRKR